MKGLFFAALIVLALALSPRLLQLHSLIKPHERFEKTDKSDHCRLIGKDQIPSAEDIAIYDSSHVLIGVDELRKTFHHSSTAKPGSIALVNIFTHDIKFIHPSGMPAGTTLHPHGIHLSNATDRLYVVNHLGWRSQVEVFALRREPEPSLSHVASIRSSLFNNMAINSVAEGSANEVYITEWLPWGNPVGGVDAPTASIWEKTALKFRSLFSTFLRRTRVFRCVWSNANPESEAECSVAATGFRLANGITISPSRETVYVLDTAEPSVTTLHRDKQTGKLTKIQKISTPGLGDNVGYDSTRSVISIGSVSEILKGIAKAEGDDSVQAPGAVFDYPVDPQTGFVDEQGLKIRFVHDGSLLSMPSAGVTMGGKVMIGAPFSAGLLICDEQPR